MNVYCPVCRQRVRGTLPVCRFCLDGLEQAERNRLFAGDEEMRLAIREARTWHQAKLLGLTITTAETKE